MAQLLSFLLQSITNKPIIIEKTNYYIHWKDAQKQLSYYISLLGQYTNLRMQKQAIYKVPFAVRKEVDCKISGSILYK